MKTDLYQKATNKIIELLEKGCVPWRRSWSQYGLAKNYQTGNTYKGINALLLNNTEHPIPYFMTFRQVQQQGGKVKKGSKALPVFFYNIQFKTEDDKRIEKEEAQQRKAAGEKIKIHKFLRQYNVFNVADMEGIEFKFPEVQLQEHEKIGHCEELFHSILPAPLLQCKDANRLYYNPIQDYINMPPMEQFQSAASYYNGLFHELAHWTGHQDRLDRRGVTHTPKFGTKPYAFEELIAELSATFLCAMTGIDREEITENNAAYIESWLHILKDDKTFIFKGGCGCADGGGFYSRLNF